MSSVVRAGSCRLLNTGPGASPACPPGRSRRWAPRPSCGARAGASSRRWCRLGWLDKFPPLRSAWEILGPLQFELATKCKLPVDIPVLCGIHDGSANFARYLAAGLDDFTLISTGAKLMLVQPQLPLERLDPLRDTVANSDLLGRPVACARFMGGREYAAIAGAGLGAAGAEVADVEALVAAGNMALPSFTASGGPLPGTGGKGRIVGPVPQSPRARAALASLYLALMASVCLDVLDSRGEVIIDGAFADHRLFAGLLAALRPGQPVAVSNERQARRWVRRCCGGGPSDRPRRRSTSLAWSRPGYPG
jgi:sugar (pentulose or hexulose) kinase